MGLIPTFVLNTLQKRNSMRILYFSLIYLTSCYRLFGQDTFSIVAADSTTREVGSAGASCVDLFAFNIVDASFLGDLLPDTGAINSQAAYLAINQSNARARMRTGNTPDEIITWLKANDSQLNPQVRQYGIVGFKGIQPSAAGFTGTNCLNYKNHLTGSVNGIYYSIQGNILSGQAILDSMEHRFRNAPGDLSCRLMAALQGANEVGADSRCASNNTSSLFAFIKVAKKTDAYGQPSLSLGVRTRQGDRLEPIDSLQKIFSLKNNCQTSSNLEPILLESARIFPNPSTGKLSFVLPTLQAKIDVFDLLGNPVVSFNSSQAQFEIEIPASGVFLVQVSTREGRVTRKVVVNKL